PANIRAMPAARTMGHAVGAGSSISTAARSPRLTVDADCGIATSTSSAPDHVDDGEDDDPHRVDEVPVEGEHPDPRRVLADDAAGEGEDRHDRHEDEADDDVEGVQADERVVRRSEQVRGDREPVFVDQSVPFLPGAVEEETTQKEGHQPQAHERAARAALE